MTAADTDSIVEEILRGYDTITVVGASNAGHKAAHYVPSTCRSTAGGSSRSTRPPTSILGRSGVPDPRRRARAGGPGRRVPAVRRTRRISPGRPWRPGRPRCGCSWIASAEARRIAQDAGLLYVENRCLIIEQRRLQARRTWPVIGGPGCDPGGLRSGVGRSDRADGHREKGSVATAGVDGAHPSADLPCVGAGKLTDQRITGEEPPALQIEPEHLAGPEQGRGRQQFDLQLDRVPHRQWLTAGVGMERLVRQRSHRVDLPM